MTTYDYERLWLDEITTEGKFPRGSIAMEVVFKDDDGKEYVWTPRWDEMQDMYATAERVEKVNEGGGDDLKQLKALQQFSGPTLTRLAKCIDNHTSHDAIKKTFNNGTVTIRDHVDKEQIRAVFSEADFSEPDYPYKFNLSNRWKFIRDRLQELNQEDYQNIIRIIEILVHRNRHIDAEERRRIIINELNKVLRFENMEINCDGKVKLSRSDSVVDSI